VGERRERFAAASFWDAPIVHICVRACVCACICAWAGACFRARLERGGAGDGACVYERRGGEGGDRQTDSRIDRQIDRQHHRTKDPATEDAEMNAHMEKAPERQRCRPRRDFAPRATAWRDPYRGRAIEANENIRIMKVV
jgi:hypothetical protein